MKWQTFFCSIYKKRSIISSTDLTCKNKLCKAITAMSKHHSSGERLRLRHVLKISRALQLRHRSRFRRLKNKSSAAKIASNEALRVRVWSGQKVFFLVKKNCFQQFVLFCSKKNVDTWDEASHSSAWKESLFESRFINDCS